MTTRFVSFVTLTAMVLLLVASVPANAQRQLVPLLTDHTPLNLSNHFGEAGVTAINQAGDYAFQGLGSSALFLRRVGSSAPVRVWQMTDEVPGYPGSRSDLVINLKLNNSGLLAFHIDFALESGRYTAIIFTFDGTAYKKVVCGLDVAPDTGGKIFERGLGLVGMNDAGDVAFTAPLQPVYATTPAPTALFIAQHDGALVRIAGVSDSAPDTNGGSLTSLSALSLNNQGEVLFGSSISGGNGGYGLFVASAVGGVRKVVANGDSKPGGGSFALTSAITGLLNNSGSVAFLAGSGIFVNAVGSGTSAVVVGGSLAPTGGSFGTPLAPAALNDAGEIAFIAPVNGTSVTNRGLFRYRPGNTIETVVYTTQVDSATGNYFTTPFSVLPIVRKRIFLNTRRSAAFFDLSSAVE